MKKSILAMLLIIALVVPVFATDKGSIEADVKAGVSFSPSATLHQDDFKYSVYAQSTFTLGAEFYYFVQKNLGLGLGITEVFPTEDVEKTVKIGLTNFYLSAKPRFEVEGFLDAIYLLGRLGYGIVDLSVDWPLKCDNGLYWAFGVGVEKYSFLVEVLYSVNYSKATMGEGLYSNKYDVTSTAINLNVGYKFNFNI